MFTPNIWIRCGVIIFLLDIVSPETQSSVTAPPRIATTLSQAKFNMQGFRGSLTFSEVALLSAPGPTNSASDSTEQTVLLSRNGLTTSLTVEYNIVNEQFKPSDTRDEVFIVIRQFPVVWNAAGERCSDGALGKQLYSADFQIGPLRNNQTYSGTLQGLDIPLHGPNSIRGRSILLVTKRGRRACATINPNDRHLTQTAIARIQGNMAGSIFFRQFLTIPSDTTIFSDVYKLIPDGVASNISYRWTLMTTGPLDHRRPEDAVSCRNTRILYDPDFRDESACSPSSPARCKIGNLMGKFDGLPVGLPTANEGKKAFFTDPDFTLSGWATGRGIYVAIFHPNNPLVSVACGEVVMLAPKIARTSFNQDGVRGSVTFRQISHFDPTEVYVNFTGLHGRATKLAVHEFPRRQQLLPGENLCLPNLIGEMYDPLKNARGYSSLTNSTSFLTQDQYAIGDLVNKSAGLNFTGQDSIQAEFLDDNLPLFGSLSVISRSLAIYGVNDCRWICSNIWPDGDVIMAKIQFFYSVGGVIYLRQSAEYPGSETTLFGNLYYTNGIQTTPTKDHSWQIHWSPVMRDSFSWDGRCVSAGEVYDPLNVDVRKNYWSECRTSRPFRCQIGDLSSRLSNLTVAVTASSGIGRFFFTENYLPLSGPFSVMGKSIVIYSKNFGDERQACATIVPIHPTKAVVKSWIGFGAGKVSGTIAAQQSMPEQETAVTIELDGLARSAASMTVHVGPTEENLVIPCTEESLGPLYDPFNIAGNISTDAVGKNDTSLDAWPIGDLSDKYGSLVGATGYVRQAFDESLPLTGPYSIIGRSIGIQPDRETRSMACADIVHDVRDMEKVIVLKGVAQFPGPFLWGYIRFTQVQYEFDKSSSAMTIEVRLAHMLNDSVDYERSSTGHRWAIHQLPVAGDASSLWDNFRCITAGLVDNYFNTVNDGDDYRSECWAGNVQRCAYGDVAKRVGSLNIAFETRQVFTDELLQLKGNVSLFGRSVVIFDVREEDNKEIRMACANIEEEEEASTTLLLQQTGNFDSAGLESRIADLLNLKPWNVAINLATLQRVKQKSCTQVTVTLRAPKATKILRTLNNFVDVDQFSNLGYGSCDKRTDVLYEKLIAAAKGTRTLKESDLTQPVETSHGFRILNGPILSILFVVLFI